MSARGPLLTLVIFTIAFTAFMWRASGGVPRTALIGMNPNEETAIEGAGFPKVLRDPSGSVQRLERRPRRIVSAFLGADEILPQLVDLNAVIGVSSFADSPSISNVAGVYPARCLRVTADTESLLALEPDLVLVIGFNREEAVRLLMAAGVPVVRIGRYLTTEDILRNISLIGAAVGEEERAATLVRSLRERLDSVGRRVRANSGRKPRVMNYSGGFLAGTKTLDSDKIRLAGGVNVAEEAGLKGHQQVSLELAISLQPEIIVLPDYSDYGGGATLERFLADPVWRDVPAVHQQRVYPIPGRLLSAVSHFAVDAVEILADRVESGTRKER